jgi:hypothetical protein
MPRLPQWPRLLASSETDSLRADTVELLPRSSIPPISSSHGTQTRATILPAFPLTARPIRQAAALAQGDGVIQDQTGGATHFFAPAAQALLGRRRKVRQAARIRLIGISNAAKIYAHHRSDAGLPGPQGPSATAATKIATQFAGIRWEKER